MRKRIRWIMVALAIALASAAVSAYFVSLDAPQDFPINI